MGSLIPADFDLSILEKSEQRVVRALLENTDISWLVLPHVPFVERGRDGEADIVVMHPEYGAVVIEVKGGKITVVEGIWHQNGKPLTRSPVEQAVNAKHVLVRKIKRACETDDVRALYITHAVAFPDATTLPAESLGPDLDSKMVLIGNDFAWLDRSLEAMLPKSHRVSDRAMNTMVRALRPTLEFREDLAPQLGAMSRKLDEETERILKTAELLDANLRVWVEGPAGSGKSRLAIQWARRAAERDERVLLLCYNKPMGAIFEVAFEDDPMVTAGSFHDVALRLLEPYGFVAPDNPTHEFWSEEVPEALFDRRDQLGDGYDTIILDEVQDIHSEWFPAIDGLLDPSGANRLYRLGDPGQNLYRVEAEDDEGWVLFPLVTNCRNTQAIAAVAKHLGGGSPSAASPLGNPVRFVEATTIQDVRKRLGGELLVLLREHRLAPSSIAVITTRVDLRDELLDPPIVAARLCRWDDRDEEVVVCETAYRLKGTEWEAVIVVNLEPAITAWLRDVLYVAVSRPRTWLTIIAPQDTRDLLGLTAPEPE